MEAQDDPASDHDGHSPSELGGCDHYGPSQDGTVYLSKDLAGTGPNLELTAIGGGDYESGGRAAEVGVGKRLAIIPARRREARLQVRNDGGVTGAEFFHRVDIADSSRIGVPNNR